jgi:hypothetical protein
MEMDKSKKQGNEKNGIARKQTIAGFLAASAYAVTLTVGGGNAFSQEPPAESATKTSLSAVAAPVFDLSQAQDNFRIAVLPIVYERALNAGNSPEQAAEKVRRRLPASTDMSILRHENATAVIAYDREKSKITVAFDATDEVADVIDDIKAWGKGHPLGGKTHGGFTNAQLYKDKQGRTLADQINVTINNFAAEQPTTLGFTGFSRGGAQATIATANRMVTDDKNSTTPSNVKLTSLYSFAGLPAGDKDFMAGFTEAADRKNVERWRVIGGDDTAPKHMTTEAWYGKDLYRHFGPVVRMIPSDSGVVEYRVNNGLNKDEQTRLAKTNWHDPNIYADLLGVPDAKMTEDGGQLPQPTVKSVRNAPLSHQKNAKILSASISPNLNP